ncbi:phosphoribosylanthranilate isomerase [Rubrolithibacter danxiaensis]|uniref:phosphoribosylanthranilate isomerase n=1 Tax=Rubrolithibacter danxiaensis TaxID=3390805 RepID=UPI003BF7E47C
MKIKVCGMREVNNIRELTSLQPDYIGFIFYPKSKRFVQETDPGFLQEIPTKIKKTGVFVNAALDEILDKIKRYRLQAVQLHGDESPAFCQKLKEQNVEVIKAFGIDEAFDFEVLNQYELFTDYFLFDTKTSAYGGSGKVFNWEVLNNYKLGKAYFLSGGLSLQNLAEVKGLNDERIYAVDLNSAFETEPAVKDINKLEQAFKLIKG